MIRSEKVWFPGAGGDRLAARLDRPAAQPRAFALFAHCFTCGKDIFAARRIAAALAESGFAVLRFDFTGLGASEGEFANANFSSNIGDLVAAADFLRETYEAPTLMIGHSLGGAAVLAAAGRVPEVRAVAPIAAPADPRHVEHLLAAARPEIEARGEAEVTLGGRSFPIRRQFLEDISRHRLAEAIAHLRKALLVFHSPVDTVVGIENASEIFRAASHPKSFVSLDKADHLLSNEADARYVATVLAAWATRYLPEAAREATVEGEDGDVLVRETGAGRFQCEILNGPHRLIADEPPAVGGDGTGPTPYGYLLAGLGACTVMTLRMYAERKGWPLERAVVALSHRKIHAADCDECETREGMVDRIERRLSLEGDLDEGQRARLLEIADKCPVHRTLHSEVATVTTLAE